MNVLVDRFRRRFGARIAMERRSIRRIAMMIAMVHTRRRSITIRSIIAIVMRSVLARRTRLRVGMGSRDRRTLAVDTDSRDRKAMEEVALQRKDVLRNRRVRNMVVVMAGRDVSVLRNLLVRNTVVARSTVEAMKLAGAREKEKTSTKKNARKSTRRRDVRNTRKRDARKVAVGSLRWAARNC
jgi:hypothetical protein